MKKMTKLMSLTFALLMCISLLSVSAFAIKPVESVDPYSEFESGAASSAALIITRDEDGNIHYTDGIGPKSVVNGIPFRVVAGADLLSDKWRVAVVNDDIFRTIDSISLVVDVFNAQGLQYQQGHNFVSIRPGMHQSDTGYIKGWTRIAVHGIIARAGGAIGYAPTVNFEK